TAPCAVASPCALAPITPDADAVLATPARRWLVRARRTPEVAGSRFLAAPPSTVVRFPESDLYAFRASAPPSGIYRRHHTREYTSGFNTPTYGISRYRSLKSRP